MLKWMLKRWLDSFEHKWNYDVGYMRDMLDAGGFRALLPAMAAPAFGNSYRRDIPRAPWFTAQMLAVRAGDCGPCLQLGVKMALEDGVDAATIRAVLVGNRDAMSDDVRLAYDFTLAVFARDGRDDALRDEVVRRWGKRALISLAYAIAMGGFYPALKYALGAGHACRRIEVGNETVIPVAI